MLRIASLAALTLTALSAQTLDSVRRQALEHSTAYRLLEQLSDGIGPRLTGSPQDARAAQWALAAMRAIGLRNVHSEPWQLERAWTRVHARAQLLRPFPLDLAIASQGWTGSTPGPTEADIVPADPAANPSSCAGKILWITPADPSQLTAFLDAASHCGALAVFEKDSRPGVLLPHTGTVAFSPRAFPIPFATVAREHADLIARLLAAGTPVRIRLDIRNETSAGQVTSNNIAGEIPGTLNPAEIVLLGAHLDSWDQGTGAIDDGFGVAAVLSAAQSILASGLVPQRTIRIVLFTGEEQGLLGSRAYVRQHQSELRAIVCALVLDWGNGPIVKYLTGGHSELTAPFEDLSRVLAPVAPIQVGSGYTTYTDAFSFLLAGVPAISPFQDSRDYSLIGHSAADTLDKVDPQILARDAALLALTAAWIANQPNRIGGFWQPTQTRQMLESQSPTLRALGLWPF